MWKRRFDAHFEFLRERSCVKTQISIKVLVCNENFLPRQIRQSIHTISERRKMESVQVKIMYTEKETREFYVKKQFEKNHGEEKNPL